MISLNNLELNKGDKLTVELRVDAQFTIECVDENEFIVASSNNTKTKHIKGSDALYEFLKKFRKVISNVSIVRSKKRTEYRNIMEKQFGKIKNQQKGKI
jgi:hypothetical protein